MMLAPSLAEMLINHSPVLAKRIFHFHYCVAEYLHHSWREKFDLHYLHNEIWGKKRALPGLSAHILEVTSLTNEFSFSVEHQEWHIVLLDASRLRRLHRYLTASLFATEIRRMLCQDDVIRWRSMLGHDAYKFALHGSKFLSQDYDMAVSNKMTDADTTAFSWLRASFRSAPEAIKARALLKLPLEKEEDVDGVDPVQAFNLVHSLLLILEQKWCSLFPRTKIKR